MINKIKPFLQSKGITPYRFQRDVAIAQRTAYDLYNNPTQLPSSNVLSKICDAYRIQPGEIIEWIDPSQNLTPAITQTAAPEMAAEQEAEVQARILAQIAEEAEQDREDDDDDISEEEAIEIERKNKFTMIATKEEFAEYGKLKTKKEQEDFMDDCIKTHQP